MKGIVLAALLTLIPTVSVADDLSSAITMSQNIEFVSGDTWKERSVTYRLYGVQSCIRGTSATNKSGSTIDCGDASMAQAAAVFMAASVTCQPVGQALDAAIFVVCGATFATDTIDLGTALIAGGYGFAATDIDGDPVSDAYLVAELNAKMDRRGLWAMTFPHPVTTLLKGAPR